jgi:AcrR family transcriptional regulator
MTLPHVRLAGGREAVVSGGVSRSTVKSRQEPPTLKRFGRPPGADSVETRRRLLSAAKIVFANRGYKEASNKLVAAEAAMTSGAIYHYFPNKRAMFLGVHEELQEWQLGRLEPLIDDALTLGEALIALIASMEEARRLDPHSAAFFSVVRTEAKRNPEISTALDDSRWLKLYDRLARLGVATGEIDAASARSFKGVLAICLYGVSQHAAEASLSAHLAALNGLRVLVFGKLMRTKAPAAPGV